MPPGPRSRHRTDGRDRAADRGRPGREASDAARPLTWAIAAGTLALLVGVGVGWHVGTRTTASEPAARSTAAAPPDPASFTIPVVDTAVPRLFDTQPVPADVPAVPVRDERIAPTDYRLLITRPDGVALHVARLGGEVCVVVVHPGRGSASGCTIGGRFPETGLWVEATGQGSRIRGTIHPDGTAGLTPDGYVPDRLPAVEG